MIQQLRERERENTKHREREREKEYQNIDPKGKYIDERLCSILKFKFFFYETEFKKQILGFITKPI